jgi:formate C-acetyltransferase
MKEALLRKRGLEMTDTVLTGGALGLVLREGKVAKTGSTKRIQELNGLLHSHRPTIDIQRTRAFTKVYKETEGEPELRRRYKAMAEVYRNWEPVIYDYERLPGWAANQIRACQICMEIHANWIGDDLDQLETRMYDPYIIPEEYKQELREVHIPYWKDKTLTALWKKRLPESQTSRLLGGGVATLSNYMNNIGSHFLADFSFLLANGIGKYYEIAQEELAKLNENVPGSFNKREFYQGISEVCLSIKQLAENYAVAAAKKAATEANPVRKQELLAMEALMRQVPWHPARNFYEAIEMAWLAIMLQFIEGAGPSASLSRFDQYMYPYYQQGIADGTLTPEKAMEFIEELYIKCTANPWLVSTDRSHINGGYFRFAHIDVGGLNKRCQDASNELSYLCLRAMRYVKTNAPTIGVLLHQKTPDSLLYEACGLAAEGMGHPSFFNCETLYGMLRGRGAGNEGHSVYTKEQILELGSPIGCIEPGVAGHQFGHTSGSFINLAECGNLVLTNGVKDGKLITCETGDATKFATFEDFYAAVKTQILCAIRQDQAGLLVAEELVAEKFALPTFTMLCRDGVRKGKDCTQGGAYLNVGATIQTLGFATLIDSLAAIKKVVYEDKEATIAEVRAAIGANFQGYELLQAKLMRAPKYGNNDSYADSIAADIWSYFAHEVRSLKMYLGSYADPAVQMVQANVAVGVGTRATANGRLAGTPLSDTMSASQQADVHGPTGAALSYGKLDYSAYTNGTLINMWISGSELIEKAK